MLFFKLENLNIKYIEFSKLIGKTADRGFEEYKVGILGSPVRNEDVYDFENYMKDRNLVLYKKKPVHPLCLHRDIKELLIEFGEKEVLGYYISNGRDVQRVYDIEKTVEKNGLKWVREMDFIFERYHTLLKEGDLELFPKTFRTKEYVELYGYKKKMKKIEKIYKMKPTFIEKFRIEKKEIQSTDHLCHINDLPILKKWMNERRVKYAHMKTMKGITEDRFIVFDLKEKDWHKIRIKLTTEPPAYENRS